MNNNSICYHSVLYMGNGGGYPDPRVDPFFPEAVDFCEKYGFTDITVMSEETSTGNDMFKELVEQTLRLRREHPGDKVYIAMPRDERFDDCYDDIIGLINEGVTFLMFRTPSDVQAEAVRRGVRLPQQLTGPDALIHYASISSENLVD